MKRLFAVSVLCMGAVLLAGLLTDSAHAEGDVTADSKQSEPDQLYTSAVPWPVTLEQPDGTRFQARILGNAEYHLLETLNGYSVRHNSKTGYYEFVHTGNDGRFTLTGSYPGIDNPAQLGLPRHQRESIDVMVRQLHRSTSVATDDASVIARMPRRGLVRMVVILANFSNTTPRYSREDIDGLFNTPGYNEHGANGSVRDYFLEASYGQLEIEATVLDWVDLPDEVQDYARNEDVFRSWWYDERVQPYIKLIKQAIEAHMTTRYDFSPFDNDGDDIVDALVIIHQGHGEETGADPDTSLWSRTNWMTTMRDSRGNGFNLFALLPELQHVEDENGISTETLSPIGNYVHQIAQMMGAKSLQSTDSPSSGVGSFGLMGLGQWNNQGRTPAHPIGFTKAQLGWLTPKTFDFSTGQSRSNITIPAAVHSRTDSVLRFDQGYAAGEYLLLENRRQTAFDGALPGSGLLITHIDENQTSNTNSNWPLVRVIQADGRFDLEGGLSASASDLFPGSLNVRSAAAQQFPFMRSMYTGQADVEIENINTDGITVQADITATEHDENYIPVIWSSSTNTAGNQMLVEVTYADYDGLNDLRNVYLLVNDSTDTSNAVYIRFKTRNSILLLRDDSGRRWTRARVGSGHDPVVLENSQVSLNTATLMVDKRKSLVTLTMLLQFKPGFEGRMKLYAKGRDRRSRPDWERLERVRISH